MKMYFLNFGILTAEEGWFFEGGACATLEQPSPEHKFLRIQMEGILIDHPTEGLIIYEVGPAPNYKELWPKEVYSVFPITEYTDENRLDNILQKAGYKIDDVSAIILGHLHLDHAGGLEFFRGKDIPIYVHEEELKYAFYAVATKQDFGAYIPHYLDFGFNWRPVHENEVELFKDITLYHIPGHTPGTMAMRVDLKDTGSWIFISDLAFYKDNYELVKPQGWLIRDMNSWFKSVRKVKALERANSAKVIPGHDPNVFAHFKHAPEYYS